MAAKKRHIEAVLAMWQSQVESANHLLKSSLEMGRNCTHTINTTTRNNIKMMTMIDSYMDEHKQDWLRKFLHDGSGCYVPGVVFDRWGNQAPTVPDVFVAQKTKPNASSMRHALVGTGNW